MSNIMKRLGDKPVRKNYIAEWREKRHGMTQEQLAERVGTYKGQVSNWETGAREMSLRTLFLIAEALDIRWQDIFRHPDEPSADELLDNMSPEVRRAALNILRSMSES